MTGRDDITEKNRAKQAQWRAAHRRERDALDLDARPYAAGIGLSGGGIRSALVCLGALETLAERRMLRHFDYLSSVSGGGYAGAALSWRLGQARLAREEGDGAEVEEDAALSTAAGLNDAETRDVSAALDAEIAKAAETGARRSTEWVLNRSDELFRARNAEKAARLEGLRDAHRRHLRAHVSYLMPGGAAGALSGFYVVARAIVGNLFIWTTLLAGLFALAAVVLETPHQRVLWLAAALSAFVVLRSVGFTLSSWLATSSDAAADDWSDSIDRRLAALDRRLAGEGSLARPVTAALCTAAAALLGWLCWIATEALLAGGAALDASGALFALGAGASGVLALLFGYIALVLWTGSTEPGAPPFKYRRRRLEEAWARSVTLVIIAAALFGGLPWISENLDRLTAWVSGASDYGGADGALSGVLAGLLGLGGALYSFWRENAKGALGRSGGAVAMIASALLVYGVAVLAHAAANSLWLGDGTVALPGLVIPKQAVAIICTVAALALALLVNINDVSLGRFYRDRLMEAFMPDLDTRLTGAEPEPGRPASAADSFTLTSLRGVRPLHLVNANVMTPWSQEAKARRRHGDNYVLSALSSGSDSTGWVDTEAVAGGRMTLATSMAISGAAVNPRGGFAGTGPTASLPVSLAMGVLNLRLGYWLRWPQEGAKRAFWTLNRFGNHIQPVFASYWRQVFGWPPRKPGFIELTDGGHFENLGLYELVRRRCGLIVIVDGGADKETSYESFTAAIHRIRDDFKAEFHFDMEVDREARDGAKTDMRLSGPQDLVARDDPEGYPKGVEFAEKGYFLARIQYAPPDPSRIDGFRASAQDGPSQGLLVYLKSAMLRRLDHTTKGYRGQSADFPYEPTSNQFFGAAQFEAYRDVGRSICAQMLDDTGLDSLFEKGPPPMSLLMRNDAFQRRSPDGAAIGDDDDAHVAALLAGPKGPGGGAR